MPTGAQAQIESVTDTDAYAIYALVLPEIWRGESPDILLQQETESIAAVSRCVSNFIARLPDSESVVQAFTQENIRVRLLQRLLPSQMTYRLIPRAEILADDARLAIKYPGMWQRRPESMNYAAVSAVGFDATRTKALVYVRRRDSGEVRTMQLVNGAWQPARLGGCSWIS